MKTNKLIRLRCKFGFNQQDMADILGITKQAYSFKENGKRGFNQKEMSLIFSKFRQINPTINMQDIFLI